MRPSGSELRSALEVALGPLYRVEREVRPAGEWRRFVAIEVTGGPDVLIKVFPAEIALALDMGRLEQEVLLIAAQLRHERVVPPLSAGAAGPFLYYVRRFAPGTTVRARLDRTGPLPLHHVVVILRELLDVVIHAHAAGVPHGDLRPDNVILADGGAHVAEWGLAGAIADAARGPALGLALAAPAYVSPERRNGDGRPSAADDIYALGAMAFEMLTGKPPGAAHDAGADRDVLKRLREATPARLGDTVMRCVAPAAQRWIDAEEVLSELNRLTGA